jgi:hypothetical protein
VIKYFEEDNEMVLRVSGVVKKIKRGYVNVEILGKDK